MRVPKRNIGAAPDREGYRIMRSAIGRTGLAPGLAAALLSGCAMLGPDFQSPDATVNAGWSGTESRITSQPGDYAHWWRGFDDPALTRLVELGYQQNLPLRVAGVRVLQARAQLGVAIGQEYPQQQQAVGDLAHQRESARVPFAPVGKSSELEYTTASIGVQAAWELDFWGKFRRLVESADAQLAASVAGYDDVLVSLTADLATAYIELRTLEQQLAVARANVQVQQEGLQIATARFRGGTTDMRDVEQAKTILASTQATIPQFEQQIEQTKNAIATLIGLPPNPLDDLLGASKGIPVPPAQVGIGIPADLLRRRPDIRQTEAVAAAQSALIGFQKADLYPSFTLLGTFGFAASDWQQFELSDIFMARSRAYSFGPSVTWNFLNYGRITNQVRTQDAAFEEALITYQNTVLVAQQEVENALIGFRKQQERAKSLSEAVRAAQHSLQLAVAQYRSGVADFTTVLVAEQQLLAQQDSLAVTAGAIPSNLVAVYRALGGGWQIREDQGFLPPQTIQAMASRTDWGRLLAYKVEVPPIPVPRPQQPRLPEW
jgi:NodT family efflux transporter outer membrane factor (OMF) lipoprotein